MRGNKTILIVEDDPSLRHILKDKFAEEGFEVLSAKDCEEGLDLALQKRPDMILLDIIMPKMDGMTMLTRLHEDAWGKMARVMILSNLGESERINDSLSRGAFDYLVKTDWTLDEVVEKVKNRLHLN